MVCWVFISWRHNDSPWILWRIYKQIYSRMMVSNDKLMTLLLITRNHMWYVINYGGLVCVCGCWVICLFVFIPTEGDLWICFLQSCCVCCLSKSCVYIKCEENINIGRLNFCKSIMLWPEINGCHFELINLCVRRWWG